MQTTRRKIILLNYVAKLFWQLQICIGSDNILLTHLILEIVRRAKSDLLLKQNCKVYLSLQLG